MVGKRLAQVIAQVPQNAEPICCMAHQLPFGTNALKEHDRLQFEKDHRINRGTPLAPIGRLYELTYKREIKRSLQMAIEVILRHQVLKRHIDEWGKAPLFLSHH